MKILNEYTWLQIKKNKRHTFSILAAITISSALLFSLCIFLYSFWQAKITAAVEGVGYWHGELYDSISGDKLQTVIANPQVAEVMVKGSWVTVQLPDCQRPYLLMRDADQAFWRDMNLKNTLTAGHLPQKTGEIVVAKQFFTDNPSYQLGDVLTLPVGRRLVGGSALDTQDYWQEDESFAVTGSSTYTLVGMLDISSVSAHPGYMAMGYLDHAAITAADELTVYLRLTQPRNVYSELPQIAAAAGLSQDERGAYSIKYNTDLLSLYAISDPDSFNPLFLELAAIAVLLLVLVMGTFVLIIYNAFSLSANSRARELSILKSIGATPRQIKYSVLFEGFLLWLLQVPLGIAVGYAFTWGIFSGMNRILAALDGYQKMELSLDWYVIAAALFISLFTVLISAGIPARQMARIPAVEGIQQNGDLTLGGRRKGRFKSGRSNSYRWLNKLCGIEGELAARQFAVNRRSLRTAILSLALCLILLSSYVSVMAIYNLAQKENEAITQYDLSVALNILDEPDESLLQSLCALPEVQKSVIYRQVRTTTYVTDTQESEAFAREGGFAGVDLKYPVSSRDGQSKLIVYLTGLNDNDFRQYCREVGTDPEQYYAAGSLTGILVDSTYHVASGSKELQTIAMLNGDSITELQLSEKVFDSTNGDYQFTAKIGAVTEKEPGQQNRSRYSAALVVPMPQYQQLAANFLAERELEANRLTVDLLTGSADNAAAQAKAETLCSAYLGTDDFTVWSLQEEKEQAALKQRAVSLAVYAVALMIALIGIFNAVATVANNLRLHKREYAMLRSVGLTPQGLNKMLLLEGLLFALSPLVISIPCVALACCFMLRLTTISWSQFMGVFPGVQIVSYIAGILAAIFLAYVSTAGSLKKESIIEAIQNEIV